MGKQIKGILAISIMVMLVVSSICNVYAAPWGGFGDRGQSYNQQQRQVQQGNFSTISLQSSIPAANGVFSATDSTITLQFSGDVTYSSTQRGQGIALMSGRRSTVPVSVTASNSSTLVITPSSALSQNVTYILYVYGLKDSTGLSIKPFTLRFNTSTTSDSVPQTSTTDSVTIPDSAATYGNGTQFTDVGKNFWGYQAISDLAKRGVISGYSDGSFKPNASVTRSEFATMLTKTLNLTATDNTQTFQDVAPSSWDYKAVEASKNYLTGYKTNSGAMYFYGSQNAVREDMAVALVKALNLPIQSNYAELQQAFTDAGSVSTDLQDYVYTAYKNGIMQGSNNQFDPQGTLTRAEAAALLEKALQQTEKVPVDGSDSSSQKVVVGSSDTGTLYDTDATLSNLTVNGVTVTGFAASTLTYNIVLPAGTTTYPTVAAAVNDAGKATSNVTQLTILPGSATVVVTAQDGVTTNTYTINFTVAASKDTDATLSNLTCNGALVAGFAAGTLTYNIVLPAGTSTIPTLTATVNDTGKATYVVIPASSLPGEATVLVTAENGVTINTYTIDFTVAAN